MHSSLMFAIAVVCLTFSERDTLAQGCPFTSGNTVDSTPRIHVSDVRITSAPSFAKPIDAFVLQERPCTLYIEPLSGIDEYVVAARLVLGNVRTGTSSSAHPALAFVSSDPNEFALEMEPVFLTADSTYHIRVRMRATTPGIRDFRILALVTLGDTVKIRSEFAILWAPEPVIALSVPGNTSCRAELCLLRSTDQIINLAGEGLAQVDMDGRVTVTQQGASGSVLSSSMSAIRRGSDGVFFSTVPLIDTRRVSVELPLNSVRFTRSDGKDVMSDRFSIVRSVGVREPSLSRAQVFYLGSQVSNDPLRELRGASGGVHVLVASEGSAAVSLSSAEASAARKQYADVADDWTGALKPNNRYLIRESRTSNDGTPVAELEVLSEESAGNGVTGILRPLAPTASISGFDAQPQLRIYGENNRKIATSFAVLPKVRVERVVVQRASGEDGSTQTVHVGETVTLNVTGAAVGTIVRGEFAGSALAPKRLDANTLSVQLTVPRIARSREPLLLFDAEGVRTDADIRVEQPQRLRRDLSYLTVHFRGDSGPDRTKLIGSSPVQANSLTDVVLRADRYGIDTGEVLYGVQYLRVMARLLNHDGEEVSRATRCVAVVPPPFGDRDYDVRSGCDRLASGQLLLGDALGASVGRATVGSRIDIEVTPAQEFYGFDRVDFVGRADITRDGQLIVEPVLQLPGPLFAFRRGDVQPAIGYTGALLSLRFLPLERALGSNAHRFSAQAGFVVASSTQESSPASSARLNATVGFGYSLRNMVGNIALDFFLGGMAPLSTRTFRREAQIVFRPGFNVPLHSSSSPE